MNKKILLPVLGAVLLTGTIYTSSVVFAEGETNNYPPIIQKLVEKFGLKEADVQAVFDEEKTQRQAEMQTRFEEKLTEAVTNGKLSKAQKQLIIAKHKELQASREANRGQMKDMTDEEREAERAKRQAERNKLQAWADENGIDMKYVMGFGGPGGHGGRAMDGLGGGFGLGAPEDTDDAQTQSN